MKRSNFLTACLVVAFLGVASAFASTVDPHASAHAMSFMFSDPGTMLLGVGAIAGPALRALQSSKADAVAAMRALNDLAAKESRDFTEAEQATYDQHKASIESLNKRIEREQALMAEEAGLAAAAPGGQSQVNLPANARISVAENVDQDPKRGFRSFGDFARSVLGATQAARGMGNAVDKRLIVLAPGGSILAAAPSTYAGEGNGADGGFLIPPDFSSSIFMLSLGEDALLPLTDNAPVSGNSMVFPKDETTPWGTTGIRAYWQGEASAATATKPVLGQETLRLKKLMALVPVSDEMLADSTLLAAFLPKKVALSIRWKTNEAILNGTGGPQPAGAFKSGAAIVVAKESGQATLTLVPLNLAKMVARLPAGSFGNAAWIINNDALPSLWTLNSNNQILYLPYGSGVGAFKDSPYGSLLGRPVIVSQHAASFTNQGDVSLVDLSYWQAITKGGEGVQTDTSMHLYFDADAMAYRTIFRLDGQSKLSAAINPANGSNTLSPFVQLGAR